MSDLLADTDAYNVWNDMGSSSIGATLRRYYDSGYKTRYTDFTNNWSKEQIKRVVGTYTDDYWVWPVKWPLLEDVDVSDNQSNAVRDAFTDFLWAKIQNE